MLRKLWMSITINLQYNMTNQSPTDCSSNHLQMNKLITNERNPNEAPTWWTNDWSTEINHPQWDKLEKSVKYLETITKKGVKVDGNCKYWINNQVLPTDAFQCHKPIRILLLHGLLLKIYLLLFVDRRNPDLVLQLWKILESFSVSHQHS